MALRTTLCAFSAATVLLGNIAHADIDPDTGIDFVRVGAPGNAAYMGSGIPGDLSIGRGAVSYEYRIGRMEVTTGQWAEFFSAAFDRPANERLPHLIPPDVWGAREVPANTPGGRRWSVSPGNENRLVGNISWRMAAMLCNWYHNGKSLDREAFLSGAYDVRTFGFAGPFNDVFTDQAERSPGARYFIPTFDEWMKAAHYDPNRNGQGQGGWWRYSITSDTYPVYGPPGLFAPDGRPTQVNSNTGDAFLGLETLLGAYPAVQSPWGLLDVAGGTTEWTESIRTTVGGTRYRLFDGSSFLDRWSNPESSIDSIAGRGADYPDFSFAQYGFRIAAVVPSPSAGVLVIALIMWRSRRHRGVSTFQSAARRSLQPVVCALVTLVAAVDTVRADIDPLTGIDFARIGAPGNAAYMGSGIPGDLNIGRGAVSYEYRIGRMEVTTGQWAEFFNAAFDRPANERLPHLIPPDVWGAREVPANTPGGRRWSVSPGNENRLVGNISWRMAAMLCNWYHNGKSLDREAFLNGAYDVRTFGFVGPANNIFTDQAARSPGARYFIPTFDEWMKAAHYDPNKNGPGQGGWWRYSITSDTYPVYGPPGLSTPDGRPTQVNANWGDALLALEVPLGGYPTVQSPWGLLDVAGGTNEWTESIRTINDGTRYRMIDGSSFLDRWTNPESSVDSIAGRGDEYPDFSFAQYGFRIAAAIPSPSAGVLVIALIIWRSRRHRGGSPCANSEETVSRS